MRTFGAVDNPSAKSKSYTAHDKNTQECHLRRPKIKVVRNTLEKRKCKLSVL